MELTKRHCPVWICCFLLVWLPLSEGTKAEEELDPFDILNFDPASMRMKEKPKNVHMDVPKPDTREENKEQQMDSVHADPVEERVKEANPIMTESCGSLAVFFKQYLLQLVNLLEPHVDPVIGSGSIFSRIAVSASDLDTFREFAESNGSNIHEVHESLSQMLQDVHRVSNFNARLFWLEEKLGMSAESLKQVSIMVTTAAVVCSSLVLFLRMMPRLGVRSIVLVLFGVSVVFTWFEMFQKEQANQEKILSENLAKHCPSLAGLPWYERLGAYVTSTFTFQDESCKEFYQATIVNPMFKINPLEVCAVVVVKTVTTPLDIVGTGIKRFLIGLLKDLPVLHQGYVMTVLTVLIILFSFLVSGYRVRIPFLLAIEPAPLPQVHITNGRGDFSKRQEAIDGIDTLQEGMEALSIRDSEERPKSLAGGHSLNPPASSTTIEYKPIGQAPEEKPKSETTSSKAVATGQEWVSTAVGQGPPKDKSSKTSSMAPVKDSQDISKTVLKDLSKDSKSEEVTLSDAEDFGSDAVTGTLSEGLNSKKSVPLMTLSGNITSSDETPSSSSDTRYEVKGKGEVSTSCDIQSLKSLENRACSTESRVGATEDRIGSSEDRVSSLEGLVGSSDDRMGSLEDRVGSSEGVVDSSEDSLQNSTTVKEVQPLSDSAADTKIKHGTGLTDSHVSFSVNGGEEGQGDADSR